MNFDCLGGVTSRVSRVDEENKKDNNSEDEEGTIGELFRAVKRDQETKAIIKDTFNSTDSSKFLSSHIRDWTLDTVSA